MKNTIVKLALLTLVIAQPVLSAPKSIAPENITGMRMTFMDHLCYESTYVFFPDGKYTSAAMANPACHGYTEPTTSKGTYEWHVTDATHATLVLKADGQEPEECKLTFSTPERATGQTTFDLNRLNFRFERAEDRRQ
jgi:hypothetical protein